MFSSINPNSAIGRIAGKRILRIGVDRAYFGRKNSIRSPAKKMIAEPIETKVMTTLMRVFISSPPIEFLKWK